MVVDIKRKRKSIEHIDQVKVVQHIRAFYPEVIIAGHTLGLLEYIVLGCFSYD